MTSSPSPAPPREIPRSVHTAPEGAVSLGGVTRWQEAAGGNPTTGRFADQAPFHGSSCPEGPAFFSCL